MTHTCRKVPFKWSVTITTPTNYKNNCKLCMYTTTQVRSSQDLNFLIETRGLASTQFDDRGNYVNFVGCNHSIKECMPIGRLQASGHMPKTACWSQIISWLVRSACRECTYNKDPSTTGTYRTRPQTHGVSLVYSRIFHSFRLNSFLMHTAKT